MITAAEAMAAQLESYGVEYVFGTCGHTNIALLDALSRSPIRFVIARHEQAAAHAADGYARVSGKPGVLLLHVGPGMMNARTWRVHRAEDLPRFTERAFWTATSGRPGAVLVNVPMDIFSRPAPAGLECPRPADAAPPGLPADVAERIAGLLVEAERPLIYIGGGLRDPAARTVLTGLAEHLDIPIAHSLMAKGAVPDDHPLLLGMTGFWGLEVANGYAREADVVLALGTRFAETDASSWHPGFTWRFPPSRLIQVDIDPAEIGRSYPVEIGAVADTALAVEAIAGAVYQARSAPVSRGNLREEIRTVETISHNLRTPIASIKASVSGLLDPDVEWDPATLRGCLTLIYEETDRLIALLGSMTALGTEHRKVIAEIAHLRLGILLENHMKIIFSKLCCGTPYIDGSLPNLLAKQPSAAAAITAMSTLNRRRPIRWHPRLPHRAGNPHPLCGCRREAPDHSVGGISK